MSAVRKGDDMGSDFERVIESFREKLDNHETRLTLAEHTIDKDFANFRRDMHKICETLIETEKSVNAKLDILLQDYHKRSGQRDAVSWVPTIFQTIVLAITIIGAIKFGIAS